jgi:hypothetical protein
MSMSVGASSNALAYLQQLLQQGTSGASSTGAADPLSELMQTLSGSGSGSDSPTSSTTDTAAGSGASGCQPFGTGTMAQLLSLQSQGANGTQGTNGPEQAFFSKLDTDGDGKISKTEFESAASKAGVDSSVADAVFDKIDGNSDGSVSGGELAKADHGGHHHHVHGGGGGDKDGDGDGGGLQSLMSGAGADGATTKSTTNADGSSTTTISYADGTSIDLNIPAAAASTGTSASSDGSSTDSSSTDSSATSTSSSTNSQTSFNLLEQLIKMQSQMLSAMQASTSTMSIAA